MSQKRRDFWLKTRAAIAAAIGSAAVAAPASAGYWTVPVNYYQREHVRFSLVQETYGSGLTVQNLAQRLPGDAQDGTAQGVVSVDDPERGRAARFSPTKTSFIAYSAPTAAVADNEKVASLSFWYRPESSEDAMVLSGGDDRQGYSLHLRGQKLHFVSWNQKTGASSRELISQSTVKTNDWHSIIVTQSATGVAWAGYSALYIDGVLEAASTFAAPGIGFLARLSYASGLGDQNFEGLNKHNVVADCAACTEPSLLRDELRQSAAYFSGNRVQYRADVGALSIAKPGWPYGVSFWLDVPESA